MVRLPNGRWFPWSREFRWDLMPWNRSLRQAKKDARARRELAVLAEAVGATVGRTARRAGFVLNAGACGTGYSEPGGRHQTILYEASPEEFQAQFPDLDAAHDEMCVDLWVYWYPDTGVVDVNLFPFSGIRGLEEAGRADLIEAAAIPARDRDSLRHVLEAYAAGLALWLGLEALPNSD